MAWFLIFIFFYALGAGVTAKIIVIKGKADKNRRWEIESDSPEVIFPAFFWPLTLPFMLGAYIVERKLKWQDSKQK